MTKKELLKRLKAYKDYLKHEEKVLFDIVEMERKDLDVEPETFAKSYGLWYEAYMNYTTFLIMFNMED